MNIKNYISGELRQEYQYKSFVPSMINHTFTWDEPQINTLLEDATRALGELNAFTMNGNSAIVSRIIKQAIEDGLIRLHDPEANRKSLRYIPFWA